MPGYASDESMSCSPSLYSLEIKHSDQKQLFEERIDLANTSREMIKGSKCMNPNRNLKQKLGRNAAC